MPEIANGTDVTEETFSSRLPHWKCWSDIYSGWYTANKKNKKISQCRDNLCFLSIDLCAFLSVLLNVIMWPVGITRLGNISSELWLEAQ